MLSDTRLYRFRIASLDRYIVLSARSEQAAFQAAADICAYLYGGHATLEAL